MKNIEYKSPQSDVIEIHTEGVLAESTFKVTEYGNNGNAIELEF